MNEPALREFTGFLWVGDAPVIRLEMLAASYDDARALITETYGADHFVVLTDVRAADRPR